jgi:NSS family neurotransmitter:Na+ symporter
MKDDITISAVQTGIGNNLVSLTAAIIIFSTVFGTLGGDMSDSQVLEIMRDSGPASTGLTFMWMPQLFEVMAGGKFFAIIFFLGLTFAAFSSLISMIELATKVFVDMGVTRTKATIAVCSAGFLFGLPSAISLDVFANQDFVWGVGLMVSGGLISFAVMKFGTENFRTTLVNNKHSRFKLGKWWSFIVRYVIPVEVISLLTWWIYLSVTSFAPDTWYNPLSPFSVATVLLQWGVAIVLFKIYNGKIAKKTMLN